MAHFWFSDIFSLESLAHKSFVHNVKWNEFDSRNNVCVCGWVVVNGFKLKFNDLIIHHIKNGERKEMRGKKLWTAIPQWEDIISLGLSKHDFASLPSTRILVFFALQMPFVRWYILYMLNYCRWTFQIEFTRFRFVLCVSLVSSMSPNENEFYWLEFLDVSLLPNLTVFNLKSNQFPTKIR